MRIPALVLAIVVCSGCIPDFLQKYRKESATKEAAESPSSPGADIPLPSDRGADSRRTGPEATQATATRATIYALDKQTFRFHVRDEEVWNAALDVLMKNYNVTIVERQSGIITTEWDSFFLQNAVYRNKISMRFRKQSSGVVDLTVLNNVERLRDASTAGSGVGAVWLPAADAANEVSRIVQNMAIVLRQPPPVLPHSAVARDLGGEVQSPALNDYQEKSN